MNKYLFSIVLLSLLQSCMDEGTFEPITNISSIQFESKYKINSNDKVLVHTKEFNREGNLIKFIRFENEKISEVSEFNYLDGKRIEKVTDVNSGIDKRVEYIEDGTGNIGIINKYDVNGQLIAEEFFEYDDYGLLLKRSGSLENFTPQLFDYKTDSNGRVNIISIFDLDNALVSYDSLSYMGNNITRFTKNGDGVIINRVEFEYNNFGKLLSEIVFNPENKISSQYIYEYDFFEIY